MLQRINKKLKSYGLWKYYKSNVSLHFFVKNLMAIALLKSNYMDNPYELLSNDYVRMKKLKEFTPQLNKLLDYYGRRWMKPSIRAMLEFHRAQFRTNNWNECESSV